MIEKLTAPIRGLRSPAKGFDSYLVNIQDGKGYCGPKIDEARRDYRDIIRARHEGFYN